MYAIVLDFEATCWENNNKKARRCEIIEFPMMILDCDTLELVENGTFHEYVRPESDAVLSEFCTRLTGITQQTVDAADTFPGVFKRAQAFLGQHCMFPENAVFVTVGNWDLEQMLPMQTQAHKQIPRLFRQWVNLKKVFADCRSELPLDNNVKNGSLVGMLRSAGLEFDGRPHSGIDDTRNTYALLAWILRHIEKARSMMTTTKQFLVST